MFSEYVNAEFLKRRNADAECRGIFVNVRCCKLDNGTNNGLKFQEYYNVSIIRHNLMIRQMVLKQISF